MDMLQAGDKHDLATQQHASKTEMDGARMGIDLAKHHHMMQHGVEQQDKANALQDERTSKQNSREDLLSARSAAQAESQPPKGNK